MFIMFMGDMNQGKDDHNNVVNLLCYNICSVDILLLLQLGHKNVESIGCVSAIHPRLTSRELTMFGFCIQ